MKALPLTLLLTATSATAGPVETLAERYDKEKAAALRQLNQKYAELFRLEKEAAMRRGSLPDANAAEGHLSRLKGELEKPSQASASAPAAKSPPGFADIPWLKPAAEVPDLISAAFSAKPKNIGTTDRRLDFSETRFLKFREGSLSVMLNNQGLVHSFHFGLIDNRRRETAFADVKSAIEEAVGPASREGPDGNQTVAVWESAEAGGHSFRITLTTDHGGKGPKMFVDLKK